MFAFKTLEISHETNQSMGVALKDEGQLEEAISAYYQALSLNPKNRRQLT